MCNLLCNYRYEHIRASHFLYANGILYHISPATGLSCGEYLVEIHLLNDRTNHSNPAVTSRIIRATSLVWVRCAMCPAF